MPFCTTLAAVKSDLITYKSASALVESTSASLTAWPTFSSISLPTLIQITLTTMGAARHRHILNDEQIIALAIAAGDAPEPSSRFAANITLNLLILFSRHR